MYFITMLISLALINADPPTGWMQDTTGFETVEECIEAIPVKATEMQYIYTIHLGVWEKYTTYNV